MVLPGMDGDWLARERYCQGKYQFPGAGVLGRGQGNGMACGHRVQLALYWPIAMVGTSARYPSKTGAWCLSRQQVSRCEAGNTSPIAQEMDPWHFHNCLSLIRELITSANTAAKKISDFAKVDSWMDQCLSESEVESNFSPVLNEVPFWHFKI